MYSSSCMAVVVCMTINLLPGILQSRESSLKGYQALVPPTRYVIAAAAAAPAAATAAATAVDWRRFTTTTTNTTTHLRRERIVPSRRFRTRRRSRRPRSDRTGRSLLRPARPLPRPRYKSWNNTNTNTNTAARSSADQQPISSVHIKLRYIPGGYHCSTTKRSWNS